MRPQTRCWRWREISVKARMLQSSLRRLRARGAARNVIARFIAHSSVGADMPRRSGLVPTSTMCRSPGSRLRTRQCPASRTRSSGRATARSRCCRRKIPVFFARSSTTRSGQGGTASRWSAGMKRGSSASCESRISGWTERGARPRGSLSPRNGREITMAWRSDRRRSTSAFRVTRPGFARSRTITPVRDRRKETTGESAASGVMDPG